MMCDPIGVLFSLDRFTFFTVHNYGATDWKSIGFYNLRSEGLYEKQKQ